jgi:GRAM domain
VLGTSFKTAYCKHEMWVTPSPVALPAMFWVVVEERATSGNLPYMDSAAPGSVSVDGAARVPVSLVLYKHKSLVSGRLGGFLDSIAAKVTQLDVAAAPPLTYRLVLHVGGPDKTGFETENSFLLAVSDEREAAFSHWKTLCGPDGMLSEIATRLREKQAKQALVTVVRRGDDVTHNRGWTVGAGAGDLQRELAANFDLLSEPSVQEYVLGKVAALAQTEEGEPVKNVEAEIAKFRAAFTQLAAQPGYSHLQDERLITYFRCTMWKGFPRRGTLYVTEHYLCFDPLGTAVEMAIDDGVTATKLIVDDAAQAGDISSLRASLANPLERGVDGERAGDRVVITFRDIRCLTKEMSLGGLLNNSIKIGIADRKRDRQSRVERGGGSHSEQDKFYSFAFLQRDAAFEVLEKVWSSTMDRYLAQHARGAREGWVPEHVQKAAQGLSVDDSTEKTSEAEAPTRPSQPHVHMSKHQLDSTLQHDLFCSSFRVFSETPIEEFSGYVLRGGFAARFGALLAHLFFADLSGLSRPTWLDGST